MSADERILREAVDDVVRLGPLDTGAMAAASAILDALTKPPGSLGQLEALGIQLAGITGEPRPTFERRSIVVAAADHGVARHGVSAYPPEVTGQMIATYIAGGAAINALGAMVGADLTVIDMGVAGVPPGPLPRGRHGAAFIGASIRAGTDDMTTGPAMRREDAIRAVAVGISVAHDLHDRGVRLIGVGEMGIGNTTAASAITAALTGLAPERVTGRGTGIDDATWSHKVDVVSRALRRHRPDPSDPIGVLAAIGGLEIGALVGVVLGAVGARIPVILDGFITGASALLAQGLAPAVAARSIAGHRSAEPGHAIALDRLGMRPLLELDLRLGEGTGAALAMTLIDAAVAVRDGMATFDAAGVAGPAGPAVPTSG